MQEMAFAAEIVNINIEQLESWSQPIDIGIYKTYFNSKSKQATEFGFNIITIISDVRNSDSEYTKNNGKQNNQYR